MSKNTVIVMGAGIVGLCCALELQKTGKQVSLIDKRSDTDIASYGNAGHIAAEQVYPVASLAVLKQIPSMLFDPLGPLRIDFRYLPQLTPWFIKLLKSLLPKPYEASSQALQLLNSEALSSWQTLLNEEGLSNLLHTNGSYLVAEKKASLSELHQQVATLANVGVASEIIDFDRLHAELPILNNQQLGGLFFPETAHVINPKRVCDELLRQFTQRGGHCIQDEILDAKALATHVEITTKHHSTPMIAEQAVVACGIFSKSIVKALTKINPPLQAERGYHLMTQLPKQTIHSPITSIDRRFIMTPMEHGLRLAGTVEYSSTKAPPNYQRAYNLLPLANGMLNEPLSQTEDSPWMGLRPTLPDSLPVIDRIGRIGYAFGHQHLGLTQAPITARWMTDLMHEQAPNTDLSAYRLGRFA